MIASTGPRRTAGTGSGGRCARYEPERRRARLGVGDAVDDARVAAVLGAVRGVDLVVDGAVGVLDRDVLLDIASADAALAAGSDDAMPAAAGSVGGADVEVITGADDPDRDRPPERAVASERGDLQLVG